jgi:hypothetical protein
MVSLIHVELGIVLVMVIGLLLIALTRYLNFHTDGKSSGLTANAIRSIALIFILPISALLAIEGIISPSATTAIYGAALGYLFSGFDL